MDGFYRSGSGAGVRQIELVVHRLRIVNSLAPLYNEVWKLQGSHENLGRTCASQCR